MSGTLFIKFFPELNEPARPTAARPADRAGSRGQRVADKRRGESADFPGESAATDLPGSAQRRGLAKSVRQAVTRSVRTSAGPGTGRVLFPWGRREKKEASSGASAHSAGASRLARRQDGLEPVTHQVRDPELPGTLGALSKFTILSWQRRAARKVLRVLF